MAHDSNHDGGYVFPQSKVEHDGSDFYQSHNFSPVEYPGLCLRDFFAAKALQGFLASVSEHFAGDGDGDPARWSTLAYAYADAMLAARADGERP